MIHQALKYKDDEVTYPTDPSDGNQPHPGISRLDKLHLVNEFHN
jgi:hypothetical protein